MITKVVVYYMKKLFVLLTAVILAPLAVFAGDIADISHADLTKAIETKSATIIDVNGSESYSEGHIPTSIDFEANKDNLAAKLPSDKSALVVAYCGSENCKAYKKAAKAAIALGYTNVKHYSGGLSAWKEAKSPLEKAKS